MRDRNRGYLIAFEGIDASGKNTQSRMLFEFLKRKGIGAEYLSFPDYSTPIGKEIKNFLSERVEYSLESRQLLYAANRYEHKERLERWLEEGKVVVINRYSESNYAYGVANGMPLKWLEEIEGRLPRADYIFLLKISPVVSLKRKPERDRYEGDLRFLQRVSEIYDALVEKGRWFAIDAERQKDEVHREISSLVLALLQESTDNESTLISSIKPAGKI